MQDKGRAEDEEAMKAMMYELQELDAADEADHGAPPVPSSVRIKDCQCTLLCLHRRHEVCLQSCLSHSWCFGPILWRIQQLLACGTGRIHFLFAKLKGNVLRMLQFTRAL